MSDYDRRYVGRAGPHLKGQLCRFIHGWKGRHSIHNVCIEFENGERVSCPSRCVKKAKP